MKQLVTFILLVIPICGTYAQPFNLKGKVESYNKEPLQSNIIVYTIDSLIIAYTQTDKNGYFTIETKATLPFILSATALGYEQQYITIKDSAALREPIQFKLFQKEQMLENVIIQNNPKIRVSGDTTSYNLSSFTLGNEKALEDALAKLPGFNVNENGRISVNGRSIQKILIEGDDLVNNNYTLLSKNMSPDMISQVQVLDKYQDDPMMKNVEKTDDVALNLTFKKEFKKMFFGDATIEAGPDKRHNAIVNGMLLTKATKAYLLVNSNNVGKQADFINNKHIVPKTTLAIPYEPLQESSELTNIAPGNIPLVENKRSFFNNTRTASLNLLHKKGDKLSVKLNTSLLSDNNKLQKQQATTYFISTDTIRYMEKNNWQQKPLLLEGTLDIDYHFSKKSRLSYTFTGNSENNRETSFLLFNSDTVRQYLKTRSFLAENHLNYTLAINEKSVFVVDAIQFNTNKPQEFSVSGYDYSMIFNQSNTYQLYQYADNPVNYIGGQARYYSSWKDARLILNTGYDRYKQNITSNYENVKTVEQQPSLKNNLESINENIYVRADYNKVFIRRIDATIRIGLYKTHMYNAFYNNKSTQNENNIFLAPDITIRYLLKTKNRFTFSYSYNNKYPDATKLFDSLIFSGYRNARRYNYNNNIQTENKFSLGYRYTDSYNQFSAFATGFFSHISNNYTDSSHINNLFTISTKYNVPKGNKISGIILGFSKFIRPLSGTFKLNGNAINNRFINNINTSADRQINNWTLGTKASYTSGFSGFFNINSSYQFNSIYNSIINSNYKSNITSYSTRLSILTDFQISKNYFLQLSGNRFRWTSEGIKQKSVPFFDAAFLGKIPSRNITITATLQNILNVKTFYFNNSSDYMLSTVEYNVLPRMIYMGVKFKF
ncbi:MAG: hypothetical protein ACK5NK_02655 [Niabella sp.]